MIVAARPGMGKTSFVLNVAVNVATPQLVATPGPGDDGYGAQQSEKPGYGVAVFSLEMPKEQVAQRMVCAEARVDVGKMRQGYLNQEDWANLTSAAAVLANLPVWIDDTPGLELAGASLEGAPSEGRVLAAAGSRMTRGSASSSSTTSSS